VPGAPEVNDGLDNQCSGDPGSGLVDEVEGDLGFHDGDTETLTWPRQPGASQYEVMRSTQPGFSADVVTWPTTGAFWIDADEPGPGGTYFYLVRALSPHVGSWGPGPGGADRLLLTCFEDLDGDGFGTPVVIPAGDWDCGDPGESLVSTDCYDSNPNAFPGQATFFVTERGDGSFDYNCDTTEQRRWPNYYTCSSYCSSYTAGWGSGSVPSCGFTSPSFRSGCDWSGFFGDCEPTGFGSNTQQCR